MKADDFLDRKNLSADDFLDRKNLSADSFLDESLSSSAPTFLGSTRDLAAGLLKIGPTAVKSIGDIVQLTTAGKLGSGLSDAMTRGMSSIDEVVGSDRLRTQKAALAKIMASPDAGVSEMMGSVLDNPGATIDAGISTIGSMLVPGGAAKGVVALGGKAAAATIAAISANGAMNAGDTYTSIKSTDQADKYKGAAISGATSLALGKLFGGGVDGIIARRIAGELPKTGIAQGAKAIAGAVGKEGGQEYGEETGNYAGETVGDQTAVDFNHMNKRSTYSGLLGMLLGGGVGTVEQFSPHKAPVDVPPEADLAQQVAPGIPITPEQVNELVASIESASNNQNASDQSPQPTVREFTGELDQPIQEQTGNTNDVLPSADAYLDAPLDIQSAEQPAVDAGNTINDIARPTDQQQAALEAQPQAQPMQPVAQPKTPVAQVSPQVDAAFNAGVDNTVDQVAQPEAQTEAQTAAQPEAESAPALQAPLQIDGNKAMQLEVATEGLKPGDIVTAKGQPFKTKGAAQAEQKRAGTGWHVKKGAGGFVLRYQPQSDKQIAALKERTRNANNINTDKDSMFSAIAKLGGIKLDDLTKQWGFDRAELSKMRGAGIRRVGTEGGMNLDRAGEALAELGYLHYDENGKHDLAEMFDLFDGELRGNKHYTPQGYANAAQAMMEQEWLNAQLAEELDNQPAEAETAIEETIDEYEETTAADENADDYTRIMGEENGQTKPISAAEEVGNGTANQITKGAQTAPAADQRAGNDGESTRGIRSEAVNDFALDGETEQQGQDRIDRQAEARQRDEADARRADQRDAADAERDTFTLTGSDRKADVAASQGQEDIFGSNASNEDGEFTHKGVRIYPITMRKDGGSVKKWAVESFENKTNREEGRRTVAGDSIRSDIDGAKEEADFLVDQKAEKDKYENDQQDKRSQAEQADIEKKSDNYGGFLDGKPENTKALIRKALDKQFRFNGTVMSIRERIDSLMDGGTLSVDTEQVPKIKELSRSAFNRADASEQRAHEKKMRDAGDKTVYYVNNSDLGKTAYDYANHLLNNEQDSDIPFDMDDARADRNDNPDYVPFSRKDQTQTPAFKKWFGDSKVVDADGRPLVVYHSTNALPWGANNIGFSEFITDTSEGGAHFGTADQANSFGSASNRRIMPVYLAIKNPLRLIDKGSFDYRDVASHLEDLGIVNSYEDIASTKDMQDAIKAAGYDGIVYLNRREGEAVGSNSIDAETLNAMTDREVSEKFPEAADSYIAFDKSQIKSATGNNGNFDGANPDIKMSRSKPATGLSVDAVRTAIADNTFNHDVDVYATMDDAPEYVRMQASKEGGGDVEGFWDVERNKVALIASNLDTPQRAQEVARHELIGHYGLENMLADSAKPGAMNALVNRVIRAEKDGNKVIADLAAQVDRTQPDLGAKRRAKEIIAIMAERNMQNSITKRVYYAIRKFLKNIGMIKSDITDAEIAKLLRDAQDYLREQGRGMVAGQPAMAFSKKESKAATDAMSSANSITTAENMPPEKDGFTRLYHGGSGSFSETPLGGTFDGFFASSNKESSWYSHGTGDNYFADIKEANILTDYALNYEVPYEKAKAALEKAMPWIDEQDFDAAWSAVIEDKHQEMDEDDSSRIFREDDFGNASWEAQRIRGRVAAELGYQAVEMNDEHGVSYLIVSGVKLTRVASISGKDAAGNNGNFDGANPDIKMSRNKPATGLSVDAGRSTTDGRGNTAKTPKKGVSRDQLGRVKFRLGEVAFHKLDAATKPLQAKFGMSMASPELRKQLRKMKATIDMAKDKAANIATQMHAMDSADREMISDIVEKMIAPGVVPPEHAIRIADAITKTMDKQTDELVELGMLSKDTADRWRGKYLPRIYNRKTELDGEPLIKRLFKSGVPTMQGIGGGSLKGRGLFEDVSVDAVNQWVDMGYEVRDPYYKMNQQGKLELLDKNLPAAATDKVTVWRDWTPSERAQMGESRDSLMRFTVGYTNMQRDIAMGRLFHDIANNPDWVRKTGSDGWVQVPDTAIPDTGGMKRYGKLAGLFVSPEVMSHLSRFEESANDSLQIYKGALGLWKTGKTALNPVAHFNNVMGNLSMAHFAGVSYWDGHKYVNAARDLLNGSDMVEEGKKAGLFTGSFTKEELANSMPPELKEMMKMNDSAAQKNSRKVINAMTFWLRKPLTEAYEFEDTFFKYLIYRDARQQNMSPEEAADYALRYIFTYDDLPSGARKVRDYAIPFFAWTYKAMPALIHTAMVYPWRFAAPAAALHGINAIAYALAAGSEDDDWLEKMAKGRAKEVEERKQLPEYMQGTGALLNPKTIRLGEDALTGLPIFLDASRVVPGGDMFDMENQSGGIPLPAPLMPNHPILGLFAAMISNKEMFMGREVVDENDTPAEALSKRAKYLAGMMLPAISPGGYHSQRMANAIANAMDTVIETPLGEFTGVDRSGQPVQPKFAVMQTLGIKARPVDLDLEEDRLAGKKQRLIRSITSEVSSIGRLHQKGAASDQMMDSARETAREKLKTIRDKD